MTSWLWKLPLNLVNNASKQNGVSRELIAAIICVESFGNPLAARYEKNYKYLVNPHKHAKDNHITVDSETVLQKTSFGLMQVMGATARDLGFLGNLGKLYRPNINLSYGAQYLARLSKRYDKLEDVIASYNAGSPAKVGGEYRNQRYVDSVLDRIATLKLGEKQ